jgi:hypothetical protein
MRVLLIHSKIVRAAAFIALLALAPSARARNYTPDEVTKAMIDAWSHLTLACQGGDGERADHDGGDPAACQVREYLQRYIKERGWCFGEGWMPCKP